VPDGVVETLLAERCQRILINIPQETRLASIAIYNEVEALNYDTAGLYALILVGISFLMLLIFYYLNRKPGTLFS